MCGGEILTSSIFKIIPGARSRDEPMRDVGWEVDTESDGDDEWVAGDDVDGEAHEVHEAGHLHEGAEDAEDDERGAAEAAEKDEDGEVHGGQRGADVLVQLALDDLVRHPVGVPAPIKVLTNLREVS